MNNVHEAHRVEFKTMAESVTFAGRLCYGRDSETDHEAYARRMLKRENHRTPFEHWTCAISLAATDSFLFDVHSFAARMKDRGDKVFMPEVRAVDGFLLTTPAFLLKNGYDYEQIKNWSEWDGPDKRQSFLITTNIGVGREYIRHRSGSFCEQSTRYVELSPEKDLLFTRGEDFFPSAMDNYLDERDSGTPRDYAREYLPLATKTVILMSVWPDDIPHILELRDHKAAHPGAQIVAKGLRV